MSWTPEVCIGELRPWPDSVRVVRGNSGEAMRYDRSERSNDGVERSSDGADVTCVPDDYTAKLMAEVARLQGENAKLLKELEAEHALAETLGHYHEDAKAENAKLRRERDTLRSKFKMSQTMRHAEYERYTKENAELRELVSFVLRFETITDGCGDTCPYVCRNCKNECYFRKVAGELGIEVDE